MIKKSTLALTVILSIVAISKITASGINRYPVETINFDGIVTTKHSDGLVVTKFPSGTESYEYPNDHTKLFTVVFSDGTKTTKEPVFWAPYACLARDLKACPSGQKKIIKSLDNDKVYCLDPYGKEISRLPDAKILYKTPVGSTASFNV